jgi:hypothetical protein
MSDGLENLNKTELIQILGNSGHGNLRLRKSVKQERLIYLIRTGEQPNEEETAGTVATRKRLQEWIEKSWSRIGSQLPCSGPLRGMCTSYPCSEGRHIECYLSAKDYLI